MRNLLDKHLRKTIGTMSFIRYIIPIFILLFTSGLSAQTVSLVPEQCGHTIQYGYPIFCTPNDSATEYEFKFFTLKDTAIISSTRNYLSVDNYYNILHTDKSYYAIVRCRFGENWSSYGDTCITMITIDWFSEKQALYNKDNEIRSRSEVQCHALDLNTVYEIPVVFHVIVPYSYREGNIVDYLPPDKINEQLKIINEFFAGERSINGDIYGNARMHFCFAQKDINGDNLTIDYHGATYYGITYKSTNEGLPEFIEDLSYPELEENERSWCSYYTLFPRDKYLNIFVFENMSRPDYYGEAGSIRLNDRVPFSHIRIRRDVVGENPEMRSEGKNKGYTAVHELGHFFGLKHTFPESINEIEDPENPPRYDGIYDIAPQLYAPSPTADTHTNEYNVMNYVPDENKRFFTPGQVCRMRETIETNNELSLLCHQFPTSTECAATLLDICSARILTPAENIVCSTRNDIITISVDNVNMIKRVSINGDIIDLAGDDVYINTSTNTIEIQYTYDALGFYEIEVSSGFDDIISNWRTTRKVVEAVDCETPTDNLEQAQWYYDSYASLDFRDGLARFNTDSRMDAFGSESSICDSDGNLLFYTDGRRIWNSQHILLVNAVFESQIKSRSTIILKFAESIYAIVSISENDGKLYSCIVEADNNNPLNANTSLTWSPLPLGTDWTNLSVLSAVPTLEPNKYWLLTTKKVIGTDETTTYYKCIAKLAYNNGIVVSDASIDSNVLCGTKVLTIKVSPNAQYVLYSTEFNGILFYRFYPRSGRMESLENCTPAVGAKGAAVEFSKSGRFLYVAWLDGVYRLKIDQYDMSQVTQCSCDIHHSEIFDWESNENLLSGFNLQRAPDGRIYVGRWADLYSNSRMIGVILNPEVRDEDNGRNNVCGVHMHAIDYNESQFLNRLFFTNLVDVTNIDHCKIDFQVCGNWCPNDATREITLVNLSNTSHNTWWFYDENGDLIETVGTNFFMNNGVPNIPQSVYQHDFVTIKLTSSECPSAEQIRTIGRHDNDDVNIDILGPAKICDDEHPHSYHVNVSGVEPPIYVEWTSPMNYSIENYDLHLTYDPNYVVDNQIPITVNVRDATTWSCPYTASRQVDVTEISYVSTPSPYCNDGNGGEVLFSINEDQTTSALPLYVFLDEYGNVHSNEGSFSVTNLPIGEYSFDITNEFCHYEKIINIESTLSDINYSVTPGCKTDTIRIWRDEHASLDGYLFVLNGYETSYYTTTNQSELMYVVNRPGDNAPYIIDSNCSIDIIGLAPDLCSLHIELYIPPHPEIRVISDCIDETVGQVEIIISNIEDPNFISFDGSSFNVDEEHFLDVDGNLHYFISNITCDYMYNPNNILRIRNLVGDVYCPLYDGTIEWCNKVASSIKYRCDSADITLTIAGATPWTVEWDWTDNGHAQTQIVDAGDRYYSHLVGVLAGIYHYTVSFGNCIRDGYVEVLEIGEPEYTMEVTNDGNSTEVCVDITSLPPGINTLVAHNADGVELINNPMLNIGRYCFESSGGYNMELITQCDTIPVYFNVFNINVDLEYEACYKSTVSISFEISGGVAPYTATFTSGSLTTTQTFSNSGQNVMYAEIMQGAANSLVVVSADGHTYNITLNPINYISGFATLPNSGTGQLDNSYIGGTYIVTSGLTFDHNVTFNGCTIYCTYEDNGNITSTQWTVNGGKTVTLDTCTIKAACPDKMWQGIKVDGDANSAHSFTSQHGKVICRNGTTIEDAIKALESTNGGIIKANGSHFNNNKYDIYYNDYSYSHSFGVGYSITPNIYDCTFSTTRLLNDNSIFPDAHICMNNVKGIQIGGCTFENTMSYSTAVLPDIGTPYYTDCRGIGIKTNMSYFNTYSANNFKKLYYGVYVNGFYSSSVKVLNSTFTDNYRGIYVNSNPGCNIKGNDISIHKTGTTFLNPDNDVDFGAYIESCSTFTFEENTISNATTGLYVYNSGTSANTVKYNTFIGETNHIGFQPIGPLPSTYNAIIVTGVNSNHVNGSSNTTGDIGLEVLCNKFQRNTNDIGVKDGYMCRYQGSSTDPTGNQFLATDVNIRGHYQFRTKFTNAGNSTYNVYQYDYYQHDDDATGNINNYVRELHTNHYSSTVIPHTNDEQEFEESYCQCNNGGGIDPPLPPIPDTLIIRIMSRMQQLGSTLAAEESELESKIDGGNTENSLTKVSSISSVSAPQINELSYNGYLSDTVCNALVDKIDENPTFVTSVFVENSPLPSETFEEVQYAEISNILKAVLSYYQSGENARITDERYLSNIRQELSLNENILYQKAMNDSLTTTDYNVVLDYFSAKTDINSKIMLCNMLISANKYDEARMLLLDINSICTTESSNCADLIDMYISVKDTSLTKDMLKQRRNQLENFIADNNYLYSGLAKTLYEYAFDTILPKYTPLFEDELQSKTAMDETISEFYPYAIYPNPTSDFINIELASNILDDDIIEFLKHYGFENIDDCATIEVNIYDINSRLVSTDKYNYDTPVSICVRDYTSGTYLVEIKGCYDNVMQTKIVKL